MGTHFPEKIKKKIFKKFWASNSLDYYFQKKKKKRFLNRTSFKNIFLGNTSWKIFILQANPCK